MSVLRENDIVMPSSYTAISVKLLEQQGYRIADFLEETGIQKHWLEQEGFGLTYNQFKLLARRATAFDPTHGFKIGEQYNIVTHGVLGLAIMSCANLEEAIQIALKYYKIRFLLVELTFSVEQDSAIIQIHETLPLEDLYPYVVEIMSVIFLNIGKFLLRKEIFQYVKYELRVSYPAPDYLQYYQESFGGAVVFDSLTTQIRFPVEYLKLPLILAEPISAKSAEKQCESQLASIENSEGLIAEIRRLMLDKHGCFPNLENLAEHLYTTPRTLTRHLKVLNTSYQEILDEVRKKLALRYLETTKLTVDEIAELLEYSTASNFSRAFKKWTDKTPGSYRESKVK